MTFAVIESIRQNVIKEIPYKVWICMTCKTALLKRKMPMQAQENNLELFPKLDELGCLCAIELMLMLNMICIYILNNLVHNDSIRKIKFKI